jgi:hypothetical protein
MRPALAGLLGAALLALTGTEATAQRNAPTRDHAVTYRMQHEGRTAEMRVHYSAATRRQRVEMVDAGVAMIHDLPGRRMLMLNEQARVAMQLPVTASQGQAILAIPDDMTLTQLGAETIAGHRCTAYRATQRGVERGTVCTTEEGILLKADLTQNDRRGVMEATAVTLADQPASLFEVPAGWQTVEMPPPPQNGQRPQR